MPRWVDRKEAEAMMATARANRELVDSNRPDPRNNPEDAYQAFMSMPRSEWSGLIMSLLRGGVLTPAEQEGFDRAVQDRPKGE